MNNKHINNMAHINYSVQSVRGGEPHNKNNVGMVTTKVDDLTIKCQAFEDVNNTRNRKQHSQITISNGDKTLFDNTPMLLQLILEDYFNTDITQL